MRLRRTVFAAAVLAMACGASSALAQATIERVEIVPESPGAPGPLATYRAGQTFAVWFTFDQTLPTSVPGVTAEVEFGGEAAGETVPLYRAPTAACRSDGRTLVCPYMVTTTDRDPDGLRIPVNEAGEGTITESAGSVLPTTRYTSEVDGVDEVHANHRVDGVSVGLTNPSGNEDLSLFVTSSPGSGRSAYGPGEVVRATFFFSEPVASYGGFAPELLPGRPMTAVGGTDRMRHFIHVVRPGDNAGALSVAGLSRMHDIADVHGNRGIHRDGRALSETRPGLALMYEGVDVQPQAIDTAPPAVTDVRLLAARTVFGPQDIDVVVAFDEQVSVDGSPLLRLNVGGGVRRIGLARTGSGYTDELTFRWPEAEVTSARVEGALGVPAGALVLVPGPGGSSIVDVGGNASGNTPGGFESLGARVDTRPPAVTGIEMPSLGEVRVGSVLRFRVTFDEDVTVEPDATPTLEFVLGDSSISKTAHMSSRRDRHTLTFGYTLDDGDLRDVSGATLAVQLNSTGALMLTNVRDQAGNPAATAYDVPPPSNLRVAEDTADGTPPTLVSARTDRELYRRGGPVRILLGFSEAVEVDGSPVFTLRVGGKTVPAQMAECLGPDTVCFDANVGDLGGDVRWGASALSDDTVVQDRSASANEWTGTLPPGGGARVDPRAPRVTRIEIDSVPRSRRAGGPADDLYYGEGDRIVVGVTTDEPVVVRDSVSLTLCIGVAPCGGAGERSAPYRSGSGTTRLTFDYRVARAELDLDGISVTGFAGRLSDLAGNDLEDFGPLPIHNDGAHPVDGRLRYEPVQDAPEEPLQEEGTSDDPDDADESDDESPAGAGPGRLVVHSEGSGADGSHVAGDVVVLRAVFDDPGVAISRPLTLELDIGGEIRTVVCPGIGTQRRFVDCSYRVRIGDEDLDGVHVEVVAGAIRAGDAEVSIDLEALAPPALRIDTRPPTVVAMDWGTDPGPDETYVVGDEVVVEVAFSERVGHEGVVTLPLRIGRTLRRATLASPVAGERAALYRFSYVIAPGDDDPDGIAVPALGVGSLVGVVRDAAGHEAQLRHPELNDDPSHVVDTRSPMVVAVEVAGRVPGRLPVFGVDETVALRVTFDEPVTVGADGATLALSVGGSARLARYVSGSGSDRLAFEYVVREGDNGPLRVAADGLEGDVADIGGNPAAGNVAVVLDATADTEAPGVAAAPRLVSSPAGGVYGVGDEIGVAVRFSERVLVTAGEVGPRLRLTIGSGERFAGYSGGSGTEELRFGYEVMEGDAGDWVSVGADAVDVADGAIRDVNGIDASVRHGAMAAVDGHRVDGVLPAVSAVAIVSAPANAEAYLPGEDVVVEIRFGEAVLASGDESLALVVGEAPRGAACSPAGGTSLRCSYTVALGDFDGDGVSVPAGGLSGAVHDAAGNAARLAIDGLPDDARHRVHAAPPHLVGAIGPVTLVAGGDTATLDLGVLFRGHRPAFEASVTDSAVVSAVVADTKLTLRSGIEGSAVVSITATNAAGSQGASFEVAVVTDPQERKVLEDALSAVGRGVLAGTTAAIGARFDLAGTTPGLTLGGRVATPLQAYPGSRPPTWRPPSVLPGRGATGGVAGPGLRGAPFGPGMDTGGFGLSLGGIGGTRFGLWGGVDVGGFADEGEGRSFDGTRTTALLGVDVVGESLLAGVAVSVNAADADYAYEGDVTGTGTAATSLTGLHPYVHLRVSDDTELWVIGGFGSGEVVADRPQAAGGEETALGMAMAVAGLRRSLGFDFGGATFALRGDAGFLNLAGEDGHGATDGLSVAVSRIRLGLESGWRLGRVAPFVTASARFDGGDGATGSGVELVGGVRIGAESSAFALEAKGRVLAVPFGEAGDGESGLTFAVAFEPGGGRGPWLRLAPRWGDTVAATDPFRAGPRGGALARRAPIRKPGWGMQAAAGYGVELAWVGGLLTPFAEARDGAEGGGAVRAGVRYRGPGPAVLSLEAVVERVEADRLAETRVLLRVERRR